MRRLLSLPPNAVKDYNQLHHRNGKDWFCTSDPRDKRLGSGSGTTWLLEECYREENPGVDFNDWLSAEKRILIHAGGQSRRLPAYAVTGKISLPVPVFRWARGQRLSQDLLSLQLSLYEKIMQQSPASLRTLVVSGDVYIHAEKPGRSGSGCGLLWFWVDASWQHAMGVRCTKETPEELDCMLQKPSLRDLEELSHSHFFLMDIGLWLLSDRAVQLCGNAPTGREKMQFYDLYSEFGLALEIVLPLRMKQSTTLR